MVTVTHQAIWSWKGPRLETFFKKYRPLNLPNSLHLPGHASFRLRTNCRHRRVVFPIIQIWEAPTGSSLWAFALWRRHWMRFHIQIQAGQVGGRGPEKVKSSVISRGVLKCKQNTMREVLGTLWSKTWTTKTKMECLFLFKLMMFAVVKLVSDANVSKMFSSSVKKRMVAALVATSWSFKLNSFGINTSA